MPKGALHDWWQDASHRFKETVHSDPILVRFWRPADSSQGTEGGLPTFHRVPEDDLRERQAANRLMHRLSIPHLRWISQWLHNHSHVVCLTDRDGIILHSEGDEGRMQRVALSPGFDWSEDRMGTNGAGTALVTRRPVAVVGCERWSPEWPEATSLAAPIFDAAGTVIGAIDVTSDVRPSEADRLVVIAHVAYTLTQEIARDTVASESHAKDDFLAALSHELRQPLAAISAAAKLMSQHTDGTTGERARVALERQLHHLHRLTSDLLEMTRLIEGTSEIQVAPVDVREVVRRAVQSVSGELASRRSDVRIEISDAPIIVAGDAARLCHALSHLVHNAVKFSESGTPVQVCVEQHAEDSVTVRVRDEGRGIAPELLPRLFEPFLRSAPGEGLGIGLAIVRKIVEQHGGSVEVQSDGPSRGAEFTIVLPVAGRHDGRSVD